MNVLIKPVVSEKTMQEVSSGKYTFIVNTKVNKHQITETIKQIYNVEVVKVNIIRKKPEEKTIKGRFKATSKLTKKAIVTLKKGQKIEGFEVKE